MADLPNFIYRYRAVRSEGKHWNDLLKREQEAIQKNYVYFSPLSKLNDPTEAWVQPSGINGVCCFSDTDSNMMLWSLYSKLDGFCIEYDTQKLLKEMNGVEANKIEYLPAKKVIEKPTIWNKFKEWSGENEVRLASAKYGKIHYHNDSISRVIFGPQFGNKSVSECNNFRQMCESINIATSDFIIVSTP